MDFEHPTKRGTHNRGYPSQKNFVSAVTNEVFLLFTNMLAISSKRTLYNSGCTVECYVDVRTNMVFAKELAETIMFEYTIHIRCYTRKHNVCALTMAHFTKILQVVNTC